MAKFTRRAEEVIAPPKMPEPPTAPPDARFEIGGTVYLKVSHAPGRIVGVELPSDVCPMCKSELKRELLLTGAEEARLIERCSHHQCGKGTASPISPDDAAAAIEAAGENVKFRLLTTAGGPNNIGTFGRDQLSLVPVW